LTIETPDVCRLYLPDRPTTAVVAGPEFIVEGAKGGTCRVRAQIGSVTASGEIVL